MTFKYHSPHFKNTSISPPPLVWTISLWVIWCVVGFTWGQAKFSKRIEPLDNQSIENSKRIETLEIALRSHVAIGHEETQRNLDQLAAAMLAHLAEEHGGN